MFSEWHVALRKMSCWCHRSEVRLSRLVAEHRKVTAAIYYPVLAWRVFFHWVFKTLCICWKGLSKAVVSGHLDGADQNRNRKFTCPNQPSLGWKQNKNTLQKMSLHFYIQRFIRRASLSMFICYLFSKWFCESLIFPLRRKSSWIQWSRIKDNRTWLKTGNPYKVYHNGMEWSIPKQL